MPVIRRREELEVFAMTNFVNAIRQEIYGDALPPPVVSSSDQRFVCSTTNDHDVLTLVDLPGVKRMFQLKGLLMSDVKFLLASGVYLVFFLKLGVTPLPSILGISKRLVDSVLSCGLSFEFKDGQFAF